MKKINSGWQWFYLGWSRGFQKQRRLGLFPGLVFGCLLWISSTAGLTQETSSEGAPAAGAASENRVDPVEQVVLVYNSNDADSKDVAEHYAAVRGVAKERLIGLDMPGREEIARADFDNRVRDPLLAALEERGLFLYEGEAAKRGLFGRKKAGSRKLVKSKVRYLILCYGTPLKIMPVPGLRESGLDKIPEPLRRNEASISQELALLPLSESEDADTYTLTGPWLNPMYRTPDLSKIGPEQGMLIVTRLDGPTPEIAKGLVDQAVYAEKWGLWGRAYFDTRGIQSGNYKKGDDMLKGAFNVARLMGIPVTLDEDPDVYKYEYPMSEVALYAGWYTTHPQGALARPDIEFMKGSIAYHLHSFSGATLRSTTQNWVGPLLAKGAAATLGCVYEPYLDFTPDIEALMVYLLQKKATFGEAAYASLPALSWQVTVVGDPLYRPFGKEPQEQHGFLFQQQSPLIEWSFLRGLNLNVENQKWNMDQAMAFLNGLPFASQSGVLLEALAELNYRQANFKSAAEICQKALEAPTNKDSQWRLIRLMLKLGDYQTLAGEGQSALSTYEKFRTRFPGYSGMKQVIQKQANLALQMGELDLAQKYQEQAK